MTLTDDQKGHEPVGDSGCYTLSTPGDFECQSTLSEPYSTVGYINEPGIIMHPTTLGYYVSVSLNVVYRSLFLHV